MAEPWWAPTTVYFVGREGIARDRIPAISYPTPEAAASHINYGQTVDAFSSVADPVKRVVVKAVTTYEVVPAEELAAQVPKQGGKKVPQ